MLLLVIRNGFLIACFMHCSSGYMYFECVYSGLQLHKYCNCYYWLYEMAVSSLVSCTASQDTCILNVSIVDFNCISIVIVIIGYEKWLSHRLFHELLLRIHVF